MFETKSGEYSKFEFLKFVGETQAVRWTGAIVINAKFPQIIRQNLARKGRANERLEDASKSRYLKSNVC